MIHSFITFNINALTNFLYMIMNNAWFLLLIFSVIGTIALRLKEEVDTSVRNEQNIL